MDCFSLIITMLWKIPKYIASRVKTSFSQSLCLQFTYKSQFYEFNFTNSFSQTLFMKLLSQIIHTNSHLRILIYSKDFVRIRSGLFCEISVMLQMAHTVVINGFKKINGLPTKERVVRYMCIHAFEFLNMSPVYQHRFSIHFTLDATHVCQPILVLHCL